MWQTYHDYCKDMNRLGTEPLPEEIWRREYAPKDETYRERPKLQGAEEISPSDFMKSEHYFDALEAQRILNEMRRAG